MTHLQESLATNPQGRQDECFYKTVCSMRLDSLGVSDHAVRMAEVGVEAGIEGI